MGTQEGRVNKEKMREYDLSVSDKLYIDGVIPKDPIDLGYAGENLAAQFNFSISEEYDGWTFYILWDGETYDEVDAQTDLNLEYQVPDDYMTKGTHSFRIELHGTTEIVKTQEVKFKVA